MRDAWAIPATCQTHAPDDDRNIGPDWTRLTAIVTTPKAEKAPVVEQKPKPKKAVKPSVRAVIYRGKRPSKPVVHFNAERGAFAYFESTKVAAVAWRVSLSTMRIYVYAKRGFRYATPEEIRRFTV